ncbi:MAG: hypothetical protein PWQ41_448 [Bacillota bacterium]|jgi:hypothetical protein|nr:hypothetical protein [Bacillota bacterium]MDK2855746.1 hypothetical protein [Bacillota bacterium]MDK2924674.1 hypothetical protein [Bacillota bacterium]
MTGILSLAVYCLQYIAEAQDRADMNWSGETRSASFGLAQELHLIK